MKKLFLSCILLLACCVSVVAQQIRPMPSSRIYQKLEQLKTLGTVMYFAAHPDDENTRMIAYLVHHDHVRTIYYSLTRGDGGQNILGDEQGAALGLIRTHELLQARKLDGAEQMFSPFVDFGYTTSVPETFHFWNKEKLVQDAVKAIQETRPDMIICRFPTTGEGIHGQHTVSAIVAKEAWLYISGYNDTAKHKLWLPKRLLFNAFHFGSSNTIKPGQFTLRINQYDPLLGEGLGELAGKSRSMHKSQGAGTPQVIGTTVEHFQVIEGAPLAQTLYDGIDTSWQRAGKEQIGKAIQRVIDHFQFDRPSASIPALIDIRKHIANVPDTFWRNRKIKEIDPIILSCAGVMAEALTDVPKAVPGATIPVSVHLIARGDLPVSVQSIIPERKVIQGNVRPTVLKNDSLYDFPFSIQLDPHEPVTEPYWMVLPPEHDEYQFPAEYLGMPEAPNTLVMPVVLSIDHVSFTIDIPVSQKKLDPVRGDITQRLRIVPPMSIDPTNRLLIYTPGEDKKVVLHIKAFEDIDSAQLLMFAQRQVLSTLPLPDLRKGIDTYMVVSVPAAKLKADSAEQYLQFIVTSRQGSFNMGVNLIDYPHIPELQYLTAAWMKIVPKDWTVAVHKIGYVEGVGDYVDNILRLCGLTVEEIPALELNNKNYLSQYDAIVIGIRALNTQKRLQAGMNTLLDYVHNGGTLIVQYNKSFQQVTDKLGPYPFQLSAKRVTDETAPVTFLDPQSALLNFPNKITQEDFNGWVQERGLYFPDEWDNHYQTLFSMNDEGKPTLKGSVLYTPYGQGQYIYTSLAFFRELPAGNTGAIRLFMNFLSAGKRAH
ncbi:MAG TPA: PIG-L family deacetylase [Edaphocola sp.]|nr:PIG-L family deacetylase [Edaphocola sp.]